MLGDLQMNAQSEHCTLEETGINLFGGALYNTKSHSYEIKTNGWAVQ